VKVPEKLNVVLSRTCNTILWGGGTPSPRFRLKTSSPPDFLLLLILLRGKAEYYKENFIPCYSQLCILTVIKRHWVQTWNPVNITHTQLLFVSHHETNPFSSLYRKFREIKRLMLIRSPNWYDYAHQDSERMLWLLSMNAVYRDSHWSFMKRNIRSVPKKLPICSHLHRCVHMDYFIGYIMM
jgi:hypothetical protein